MSVIIDTEIRRARLKEASAISGLLYDCFAEKRSYYTLEAFAFSTPPPPVIENRILNKTVWVIILNNEIVATVSGVLQGESFFIRSMGVKKNARRTGLAKILMYHMEKIALENNCKYLKLTTTSFLIPAMNLYQSLGFRQCGEKDLHGTTLVKMIKNISN